MAATPRARPPATRLEARAIALAFSLLLLAPGAGAATTDAELQHVFGGRTVAVNVPCHTIELSSSPPVALRARLVQRTSGLAAPLGEPQTVTRSVGSGQDGALRIDVVLPAVRRETRFDLHLESRVAEAAWRPAQPIALQVYPADLLAPLRHFALRRRIRVVEDGAQPRLATFLAQHDIRFVHAGEAPHPGAEPPITLRTGKAAQGTDAANAAAGASIHFTERASGLAHVEVERARNGGPRVTVAMPLLDRLETDPAAQTLFLRIFELLEARTDPRTP